MASLMSLALKSSHVDYSDSESEVMVLPKRMKLPHINLDCHPLDQKSSNPSDVSMVVFSDSDVENGDLKCDAELKPVPPPQDGLTTSTSQLLGTTVLSDEEDTDDDMPTLLSESDDEFGFDLDSTSSPKMGIGCGFLGTSRRLKVLEVFSGCGHLSQEFQKQGFECDMFDIGIDSGLMDLSKKSVVDALLQKVRDYDYVHFAPPCNTYSNARWPKVRN